MNFLRKRLIKITSISLLFPAFANFCRIVKTGRGRKKIITALTQHLGDNIAVEPLDSSIKKQYPISCIIRIVSQPYASVLINNPNIDKIITVSCLSEWIYLKPMLKLFYTIVDFHIHSSFCAKYRLSVNNPNNCGINVRNYYNHGNLLQVFCKCAKLPELNMRPVYRIPTGTFVEDTQSNYAVIQVTSNSELREWEGDKWIELIDYLGTKHDLLVIEVGLKSTLNCNLANYKNYCGRLSINEIAFMINRSRFFVGIDSAFAHFANAFQVPSVFLLGHYLSYKYYLPYSGLTEADEKRSVIHFDGPVKHIPVNAVIEKINMWVAKQNS